MQSTSLAPLSWPVASVVIIWANVCINNAVSMDTLVSHPILLFPRHFGDSNWGRRLATLPPDHIASISHTDEVFFFIAQMKESISIPRTQCPVVRCFRLATLMGGYQCTSLPSTICIQNSDLAICLLLTHANEGSEKTQANREIQFPQLPVVLNMNAEPMVTSLKNRLLAWRVRILG